MAKKCVPAVKVKVKRARAESCEICSKVPGITPDQVGDPRTDVCKPGALDKMLGTGTALVEVRQDGCAACKEMDQNILPKVEATKIVVTLGTVPACDTLADRLKVKATPTLIFYKSGRETGRMEGVRSVSKDLTEIRRRLSN